jgi:hypothetical protein
MLVCIVMRRYVAGRFQEAYVFYLSDLAGIVSVALPQWNFPSLFKVPEKIASRYGTFCCLNQLGTSSGVLYFL